MLLAGFEPEEESPDRLPAAAQGRPQERPAGLRGRAVRHPRPDQDVRHADRDRARRRGRGARTTAGARRTPRAAAARARSSWSASGWPRRPARSPPQHGWPARPAPGWPGCRAAPASAARSRPARCPACCPAAVRSPTRRPASRPPPPGTSSSCPTAPGRDTDAHPGRRARRRARRAAGRRRRPADLRRPGAALAALEPRRFVVSLELRRQRGHRARRRGVPGRAGRREGRHVRQLGGPDPAVRGRRWQHQRARPTAGADTLADEIGVDLGLPPTRRPSGDETGARWALGRAARQPPRRWPRGPLPPPARARRCWPAGGCCSTTGGCRTANRHLRRHRRARRSRGCRRRPPSEIGAADGEPVTVSTDRGAITLPLDDHRHARPAWCGCR